MGETKDKDTSPKTHREMDPENNLIEGEIMAKITTRQQKRGAYLVHPDLDSTPPSHANHKGIGPDFANITRSTDT